MRYIILIEIVYIFALVVNLLPALMYAQSNRVNANKNFDFQLPELTITINKNPSAGFLFLGATDSLNHLMVLDNQLVPVFYKKFNSGSYIFDFKLQPNKKMTYNLSSRYSYGMDYSGVIDEEYVTPPGFELDVHDLQVMGDGSYYVLGVDYLTVDMSEYVPGGDTAAVILANTIHHMDSSDNEVWRWHSFDHYDIMDADEAVDLTQHVIDWTHCNSIEKTPDGNIILSTRNFNEITKINRQTGEIIWRFGGEKNQFQFINDFRGFGRQHDARIISNGNLAFFDNGHFLIPEYSSYVEYQMDEQNMTATLMRRYSRGGIIYSEVRGGIQELANGNILISWDNLQKPLISEIDPEDSTLFEVRYNKFAHQYRAYKFPWKTNLFGTQYDSLNFGVVPVGQSSALEIKLYNRKDGIVSINEIFNNDSSFFVDEVLPIEISPHNSVDVTIVFEPKTSGNFIDNINFRFITKDMLIARQVYVEGRTEPISVDNETGEIDIYSLSQNYPNPFNSSTTISYSLPSQNHVAINIFNSLGEDVAQLVNEIQETGTYKIKWQSCDLSSGIYFYSIDATQSGGLRHFKKVKKMILLK